MDPATTWALPGMGQMNEKDMLIQSQRNDIEVLQRRCGELLHERALMKASTATDIRNFVLNYQAQKQLAAESGPQGSDEHISVDDLLMFLHKYSNGLVPPPENKRKRTRDSTPLVLPTSSSGVSPQGGYRSSSQQRVLKRMRVRHLVRGHEDEIPEQMDDDMKRFPVEDLMQRGVALDSWGRPCEGETHGIKTGHSAKQFNSQPTCVVVPSLFGLPFPSSP